MNVESSDITQEEPPHKVQRLSSEPAGTEDFSPSAAASTRAPGTPMAPFLEAVNRGRSGAEI